MIYRVRKKTSQLMRNFGILYAVMKPRLVETRIAKISFGGKATRRGDQNAVLCILFIPCVSLFVCALWSPAWKGLTSWLSFVAFTVSLSLSHWYPRSGVLLGCIDS